MVAGVELLAQAIDSVIMRVQVSSASDPDPDSLDPDPDSLDPDPAW
jgi:hypothetical protein